VLSCLPRIKVGPQGTAPRVRARRAETGRAVSRVLFPHARAREDGHLSGTVVADRLERPTRGSPSLVARGLAVWVTPRRLFGLAPTGGCRATVRCRRCGGLLPHLFTLTPRLRSGRFVFCGPVRRLAAPRRYLAVYPMELGLSSGHPKVPATTALDPLRKDNSPVRLGPTAPRGWGPALSGPGVFRGQIVSPARPSRQHPPHPRQRERRRDIGDNSLHLVRRERTLAVEALAEALTGNFVHHVIEDPARRAIEGWAASSGCTTFTATRRSSVRSVA
jgi:hypothetical protein